MRTKKMFPLEDFQGCFYEKSVLVTGHTGFKGSWLTIWLSKLGAKVSGIALDPPTYPSNYELCRVSELMTHDIRTDIRDRASVVSAISTIQPNVIFHLAGQPILAHGIDSPFETFEINTMGTASVLEAVRTLKRPCVVVVITSDKCYENTQSFLEHPETDRLGGSEPYGASKAAAELVVSAYRETFFRNKPSDAGLVSLASARAGNVIGGGDWSSHRIIPDIIKSLMDGTPVTIRSPSSVRPWQHVIVPLSGYLMLAAKMISSHDNQTFSGPWNFGPYREDAVTVKQVVEKGIQLWNSGSWLEIENPYAAHETTFLSLSIDKAMQELGWRPRWNFETAMEHTISWYAEFNQSHKDMRDRCLNDIDDYVLTMAQEHDERTD